MHFLDQRMKDLGRQTTELIFSLEQHAVRREAIYERINAEQSAELDKKREKVGQYLSLFFLYFSVFSVFFFSRWASPSP